MVQMPLVLAQEASEETAATGIGVLRDAASRLDILSRPEELLDLLSNVPIIAASMIIIVGLLCVINGYRWHKWVVVILAFAGGLGLGQLLSVQMGKSTVVAVAIGALCAIVATPLLKIAVAIFGGLTGAFIGANAWTAIGMSGAESHWPGTIMGFAILAMASFMLFRLVVVLFTSVGGAAMIVFGSISLLMIVPDWEPTIRASLSENRLLIPLLVTVAAVGGFVIQHSRVRAMEAAESE